jgi:hypothetical protein
VTAYNVWLVAPTTPAQLLCTVEIPDGCAPSLNRADVGQPSLTASKVVGKWGPGGNAFIDNRANHPGMTRPSKNVPTREDVRKYGRVRAPYGRLAMLRRAVAKRNRAE